MEINGREILNDNLFSITHFKLFAVASGISYFLNSMVLILILLDGLSIFSFFLSTNSQTLLILLYIISLLIMIYAMYSLQGGYINLPDNQEFSEAITGISVFIYGAVMAIIGIILVFIGSVEYEYTLNVYLPNTSFLDIVYIGIFFVTIGSIMELIGIILGLIIGLLKLDNRFGDFRKSAILYVIGLFIPFIGIVASYFIFSNSALLLTLSKNEG